MTVMAITFALGSGCVGSGFGSGCNPAMMLRRPPAATAASEPPCENPALETAVLEYLRNGIEKHRQNHGAKLSMPKACPMPMVDWGDITLTDLRFFPALGIGDATVTAIAKPTETVPKDERLCSAKVAFRYHATGMGNGDLVTQLKHTKIRAVWLLDQSEPLDNDEDPDDEMLIP